MENAEDVIRMAISQIGVKESPPDSNNVKYNTWFYGKEVHGASYPWCCAFVCWVLHQCGMTAIKKTASCMTLGEYFKSKGQFFKDNPQPGDIVFFKFSTNSRWTNHVGIVESVNSNGSINTIEGNTSRTSNDNGGCVMARVRKSNIVGYGRPDYSDAKPIKPKSKFPELRLGSNGADVKELQHLLNDAMGNTGAKLKEDGDFGQLTYMAVIEFQGRNGLTKDGVVGKKTWTKLIKG